MTHRKSPWLAAVCAGLLGPLGFLYLGWRYAVAGSTVFALFILPITLMGWNLPGWFKYPFLLLFAWRAFQTAIAINLTLEDGWPEQLKGWRGPTMTMTDMLVSMGMLLVGMLSLLASIDLFRSGSSWRGLFMLLIGTPLLIMLVQFLLGWIAMGIDALVITLTKEPDKLA